MHRTVKSLKRPDPHVFAEDPEVPPDWGGTRFCCCGLKEPDDVHVSPGEVYSPTPAGDRSNEILGEAG